ncbi:MAG: L-threonylcarbamoyladenylate synthase [Bacteroidales bacterium]|nr:L-threonylcarbamoyladenylate synthase [Bacteroidales bacterium]
MNEEIKKAIEVISKGGVILYPTDTIWGIGCDATNEEAVKRIYEIKKRSDSKAMLVLIDNEVKLNYYMHEVPEIAYDLIEVSDRPLTIIYPGARNVASNLIGSDGTLGIRVTRELFSRTLCERARKPIVSTSANINGESSPRFFSEISEEIKNSVDYIVQFRQDDRTEASPSQIIKLGVGGQIEIIRK